MLPLSHVQIESINELFVEARDEIEYAMEDAGTSSQGQPATIHGQPAMKHAENSFTRLCHPPMAAFLFCTAETVYFNESCAEARRAVQGVLERYEAVLQRLRSARPLEPSSCIQLRAQAGFCCKSALLCPH